jgi:hypothetical protein
MLNIILNEMPQNNNNNQSSSINPQFINKKRENNFTVKKIKKRTDNKRREYFWTVFRFLMEYISKVFGLEFNLNFQKQFEAIYGCTIKKMKNVLSFKIYQIISLFKNPQLDEKGNSIKDAYTELKKNFMLYKTFIFLMECTYDQLLEYYFTNNIEPKRNINISSLMELIKKDKNEIMNAIQEIKNKKGRKERKDAELKLDESMTSFRNFEQKYLEKDNEDNTFNNLTENRLTDYTSQFGIINFIEKKFVNNNNNNLYETDEFNNLDNRDVVFYKSDDKIMKPFFSPIQNNDSLANLFNINTNRNNNDFPSPIPLNHYNLGDNDI